MRQQPPPTPLQQLFPQPTGKNGYEDLLVAAELLKSSPLYREMELKPTLSLRRKALLDPPVRRARALLDSAFTKPILPPQRKLDFLTSFPELAPLRGLARFLDHEMYVFLAEGRTVLAINNLTLGLQLGQLPKGTVLIGGLVGVAIDAIILTRIARHLPQLSYRDCERVIGQMQEQLQRDRAAGLQALTSEFSVYDSMVSSIGKQFQEVIDGFLIEPTTDPDGTPPDPADVAAYRRARQQLESIGSDPAAQKRVTDGLRQQARLEFERNRAYLQAPHVPPAEVSALPQNSLEAYLANATLPMVEHAVDRFVANRIVYQLLGVHAALHRYRWEYGQFPKSLSEVRLQDLTIDPYTTKPLIYQVQGDTYELCSAGPLVASEAGGRTTLRQPVYLPHRPPKEKN